MRRVWSPSVIGALAAAVILLSAGVLMAVYQEQLYSNQQIKSVREQAQILAASAAAAILFEDHKAALEYVDALRVNPELQAAAVYGGDGQLVAGFARGTRLPPRLTTAQTGFGAGYIDIAVPASQNGARAGIVLLRAVTEPAERRYARYAGLILLVTMGALVIAVLSFAQAQLSQRALQLADVNTRLHEEMDERRKTEEALRQSHKMEAIGQLSGGIAHDFNNLIMIVKGNLRLLRRKLSAEADVAAPHIASADEALDRAAHLTQRILAFSRRQPLTPQRVNLNTLAQGMSELVRHSVGERVEITMRLNGAWSILCDVSQMENVILNLAINARDAMPDGGRLVLETRDVTLAEPPGDVESQSFVPGEYASLTVTDTGMGMAEDVRRRAVDPFFTTKPQGKGTGLGLSMTFGFVRQSGGYLVIDSIPGKGTAVTILMPRAPDSMGENGMSDKTTILVAEDEAMLRVIAVEMLEDAGFKVFEAGDGVEALDLLKANPEITLLVSDIKMPRMDGYALVEAGLALRPDLKVLLMTGYANEPPPQVMKAREIQILHKPFNLERLCTIAAEMTA